MPRRIDRRAERPPREGGFTLVELMIAMAVGVVLVGLVFAIYSRMSVAYRTQAKVSELQQTLRAANSQVLRDIRNAGYLVPNGFRTQALGTPNVVVPPIDIVNNADGTGPDVLRVAYADASAVARITNLPPGAAFADVDDSDLFEIGDIAVLVHPRLEANPLGGVAIAAYDACVVEVTNVAAGSPGQLEFANNGGVYNAATNSHCDDVVNAHGTNNQGMVYRFVARSYRIDPNRKDSSVFQMSPSGELEPNDWVDLGIGFTDFQIASRYFEDGDAADPDGDGDATRDWYSGENQENPDLTGQRAPDGVLQQLSVSFAVRTLDDLDIVASGATPNLTVAGRENNNRIGDSAAIVLDGVPDAARADEHKGNHVYRFSISLVDIRNLGVGL